MLGYIILTTGWISFKAGEEQGGADGAHIAGRVTRKGAKGSILGGREERGRWRGGKEEESIGGGC